MGPSYGCIFMGRFEYLLLQQYNKLVPDFYKRYSDDVIGTISLNYNQLLDFINFEQNFDPAVQFTYHISDTSVTFLDIISLKTHSGLNPVPTSPLADDITTTIIYYIQANE